MQIQVTKLRLALAALVLVAAGAGIVSVLNALADSASATAGQIVNVSDPTLPNTAKVAGSGALKVSGAISAVPVLPATPWTNEQALFGGPAVGHEIDFQVLAATVGARRLTVSDLTIRTEDYGSQGKVLVNFRFFRSPAGVTTCPTDGNFVGFTLAGYKATVLDTPSHFLEVTFPTGWSARGTSASNQVVCLSVLANFFDPTIDRGVAVQGTGFLQ
jgi:hypothetical protein